MSKKILLLFVLITNYAFSQTVNDYQYVIVPSKFSIFKEKDKYNMNTSVKLLLQKYGFKAFMSTDSIPNDIANSNCMKLNADLVKDNSLMTTRVKIVLTDCRENVVFETAYGKSTDKDYARAYMESLREAAKSFDKLNYRYNGKNQIVTEENTKPMANQLESQTSNAATSSAVSTSNDNNEILYFAQPIVNGFQIIDSEPKVIMKIFNTSVKNVFIGAKGSQNGVVISKGGQWFFEYYENGKLISELLKVKF
ncbi:MAG: hypothetical protein M0D53_10580 [Flavobacterium sp. JAD_PAG50586_2]|nr:MAG: hypothetical protein M0D53_10580 [Flavobacterium sp. JAD_PAG50586_2]